MMSEFVKRIINSPQTRYRFTKQENDTGSLAISSSCNAPKVKKCN